MIDRVDLLIAVIGIVASVTGSSAALWLSLSKKADKDDVRRLEDRMEARIDGLDVRFETGLSRVESKLDTLILRIAPERPRPEN